MNILKKLFYRRSFKDKEIAKKRLQLVLIQDRLELSQSELGAMKNDIVGVIAAYLPINKEQMEIKIRREDDTVALIANIPVTAVSSVKNR